MLNFVHQVIVPVRKTASEASEQVTQLLFGDCVEVLEEDGGWRKVRNQSDGYEGWANRKLLLDVEENFLQGVSEWQFVTAMAHELTCSFHGLEVVLPLTMGCKVPVFDASGRNSDHPLRFGPWEAHIPAPICAPALSSTPSNLLKVSERYLGAPYLWGGKSKWGIDCSGFTQMVHSFCGIQLPRDAYQQADAARKTIVFGQHQPGDLAFFKNEAGRITHVGLVISETQIRHAHGFVHDAWLRPEGIFSPFTQLQTHTLAKICRFL